MFLQTQRVQGGPGNASFGGPSTQGIPAHVSDFRSFSCPDLGPAPYLGGELNLRKRLATCPGLALGFLCPRLSG